MPGAVLITGGSAMMNDFLAIAVSVLVGLFAAGAIECNIWR